MPVFPATANAPFDMPLQGRATLSHMEVGVRDLRNRTGQVVDAVKAGGAGNTHGARRAGPGYRAARKPRPLVSANGAPQQLAEGSAADPALTAELEISPAETLDNL